MGLILTAWHHVSVRTELHHKVWFVVYNSGWLVHVRMDNWLGTIEVATWKGNLAIQRHCAIRHTLRVDRQSSSQTGGNYDDMGEADIPTKLQINFRHCLKHPCQQTSLNGAAGCTPLYSYLCFRIQICFGQKCTMRYFRTLLSPISSSAGFSLPTASISESKYLMYGHKSKNILGEQN